jgi:hypothetical protein
MSITCKPCLPPLAMVSDGLAIDRVQMACGTWWRYTLSTRSGKNTACGVIEGKPEAVLKSLDKFLARMEQNEQPSGQAWSGKVLRSNSVQLTGAM